MTEKNDYEAMRIPTSAERDEMRIPIVALNWNPPKLRLLLSIVWMCIVAMKGWVIRLHWNVQARTGETAQRDVRR